MDNLTILSKLAEIRDVQDFRLRDLMSELGLDERQPSTFYRRLLKESRDAIRLISYLQNQSNALENALSELETEATTQERQIADLKVNMSSLENKNQQRLKELEKEYQQRIKELESENLQLKATASGLHERARNYEGIRDFMRGRIDIRGLSALYDLISDIYTNALAARRAGIPEVEPADLDRLAPIRARLREEFMLVLQIPKEELEERLKKAERLNEAFESLINNMFGSR